MTSALPPIPLHAAVVERPVTLDGDDRDVREAVTTRVAAMLGDPAAVILTGSCSAALDASATLTGVGPGDEVIVPAFTFPTSVSPFVAAGATVRFADIDPTTANVDPGAVEALLSDRTRAVSVTHYGGVAVDLAWLPRATAGGADLIEDAAHGLFATAGGRALGTLGRFGCLSFHHTKNVSALEGGALVVTDPADVEAAWASVDKGTNRVQFDRGEVRSYEWVGLGSARRMPEAAVRYLAAALPDAEKGQARRHEVWATYQRDLHSWASQHGVGLPLVGPDRGAPSHLFWLVLPTASDRPRFVEHCRTRGVASARHFGSLPDSEFGARIRHPDDACPVAGSIAQRLVRIPLHQGLESFDVDRVVDAVVAFSPS